jgi:hypothetical protein
MRGSFPFYNWECNGLDLDEMIHNLEAERRRIEEALQVLRRLHQIRKPSGLDEQPSESDAPSTSIAEKDETVDQGRESIR